MYINKATLLTLISALDDGYVKEKESLGGVIGLLFAKEIIDENFFIKQGRFNDLLTFIVQNGLGLDELAKGISWRGFEGLVEDILINDGFNTLKNLRVNRNEIDVVAIRQSYALSIDCKHWSRMAYSSLRKAAIEQIARTKKAILNQIFTNTKIIVPIIVTLYDYPQRIIEGVPIVQAYKLFEFSLNLIDNMEEIYVIHNGPVV